MLDLTYLHSVSDGDKELEKTLIEIFLSQLPEFEESLNKANEERDYPALAATAHKAKSSIEAMGMTELSRELKHLEMLCKQLYVDESKSGNAEDKRISDYTRQLSTIDKSIKDWLYETISKKDTQNVIKNIIIFYKLQTEMVREELKKLE